MANGQSYEITIREQVYRFSSTDPESHVRAIETLINDVVEKFRQKGEGHQLSEFAMKVMILLADMAVRNRVSSDPAALKDRFEPLFAELERLHQE